MLIIIGETPLSKNQYTNMHWGARARYKQRILQHMVLDMVYRDYRENKKDYKGVNKPPWEKADLIFRLFFNEKIKRNRDIQNYLGGGLIAWIDNLVKLDILKDDSAKNIGQPQVELLDEAVVVRTEIRIIRKE